MGATTNVSTWTQRTERTGETDKLLWLWQVQSVFVSSCHDLTHEVNSYTFLCTPTHTYLYILYIFDTKQIVMEYITYSLLYRYNCCTESRCILRFQHHVGAEDPMPERSSA